MKRYPINRFKKDDGKLSFIEDLNRDGVKIIPRLVIKNVHTYLYTDDYNPGGLMYVDREVVDLHFSDRAFIINGNKYIPIIDTKGISFSQKVDIDSRAFNTSKLKINLINNLDFSSDDKFTDIMSNADSLSHKEIHLYFDTSKTIDSYINGETDNISMLVFKGKISSITHNLTSVTINAEDSTETSLKRMLPPDRNLLPNDDTIQEKYRGEPIPLVYGALEKAPTVIQNGVIKASSDNLFFLVAPPVLGITAPYDATNGFVYNINYQGISSWRRSYEELVQHPIFHKVSVNSPSPVIIKTSTDTCQVLFEIEEHMNNTVEELGLWRSDRGDYFHNLLNNTSSRYLNGIQQYDVTAVDTKGWVKLNREQALFSNDSLQIKANSKCNEISLKYRSPYGQHNGDHVDTGYDSNPERFPAEITEKMSDLKPGESVNLSDYPAFSYYPMYTYSHNSHHDWPRANPNNDQVMQSIARLRFSVNPSFSYISMSMNNLKFAINGIVLPKLKGGGWFVGGGGQNQHLYLFGTSLNIVAHPDIYQTSRYQVEDNYYRIDMNFTTGDAYYLNSYTTNSYGNPLTPSYASYWPDSAEYDWPLETGQMNELFQFQGSMESSQSPNNPSLKLNTSVGFTDDGGGAGTVAEQWERVITNPFIPANDFQDASGNNFQWGMPYLHLLNEQENNKSIDIIFGYFWATDASHSTTHSSYLFDLDGQFTGTDFQNIYDVGDVKNADYYLAVSNNIAGQLDVMADIVDKIGFDYQDDDQMGVNQNASGDLGYTNELLTNIFRRQAGNQDESPKFDFSINKRITIKKLLSEMSKSCIMGLTPHMKSGELSFSCILQEYSPFYVYNPDYYDDSPSDSPNYLKNRLLANQVININNSDIIKCDFTKTPYNKVYSKVKIKYNYDYTSDKYMSETEATNYNQMSFLNLDLYRYPDVEENILEIESKFIRRRSEAKLLSEFYYQYHKNQHLIVKIKLPLRYAAAQIGMILQFHELVNGKTAHGIDYTKASNPTLKSFIAKNFYNDQRTTQWIYPFFYINAVKLNLDYVEIEAVQLHFLNTFEDITEHDETITPINEMETFVELGLVEQDSLDAFERSRKGNYGWGPVFPGQDSDDIIYDPPVDNENNIYGCTIHWAQNYQPDATIDNYNCVFTDTGTSISAGNDLFIYPGQRVLDMVAKYFENLTMAGQSGHEYAVSPQEGIIGRGVELTKVLNHDMLYCCLHWEEGGNNFGGSGDGTYQSDSDGNNVLDTPEWVMRGGQGIPWDDEASGFNYLFGKERWGYFDRVLANEILEQLYADLYLEEGDEIPLDWNSESFFWSSDQYQEYLSFNYIQDWNDLLPPHFFDNGGMTTNENIGYVALRIKHRQTGRWGLIYPTTYESNFEWVLKNSTNVGEAINLQWHYEFLGSGDYGHPVGIESAYIAQQDYAASNAGNYAYTTHTTIENHTDFLLHWDGVMQKENGYNDMYWWESSMGPTMRPNPEGTYNSSDDGDSEGADGYQGNFELGRGDVNLDGNVNVLDVVLAVNFIMGFQTGNVQQMEQGDTNDDGVVDVLDIVLLVTHILDNNGETI